MSTENMPAASRFVAFPRLPAEIRSMIWKLALEKPAPRIVTIVLGVPPAGCRYPKSNGPPPVPFELCHESREMASKVYANINKDSTTVPVWVHPVADKVLVLNWPDDRADSKSLIEKLQTLDLSRVKSLATPVEGMIPRKLLKSPTPRPLLTITPYECLIIEWPRDICFPIKFHALVLLLNLTKATGLEEIAILSFMDCMNFRSREEWWATSFRDFIQEDITSFAEGAVYEFMCKTADVPAANPSFEVRFYYATKGSLESQIYT
ncbi:hypothetical protein G7046_g4863 [Stylonectria norvegica]|nr:hypothetical protein G7046_g4863 [Stylonectria norvegica]